MRVLPVTGMYYQSKKCSPKQTTSFRQQNMFATAQNHPSFKRSIAADATLFGAILGGAALILAAPVAVIAGAAASVLWASYNGQK